MSFLAASFLVGTLAIAAPIYIHMIRRAPSDKFTFSTLRFLQPCPEIVSSRSRIQHWLLLLLRALAIILLCFAFARPFFISNFAADNNSQNACVLFLVDNSASMNRQGLQDQLSEQLSKRLDQLKDSDTAAIYTFDQHIRAHTDFNKEKLNTQLLKNSLNKRQTAWGASNISQALSEATEKLLRICDEKKIAKADIEIFTDLQEDEDLEKMQQFAWPENIKVIVHKLSTSEKNASIHILGFNEDQSKFTLKVTNHASEALADIKLNISHLEKSIYTSTLNLHAGKSETVSLSVEQLPHSTTGYKAQITGDNQPFDNQLSFIVPTKVAKKIAYLGKSDKTSESSLFYLQQLFPSGNNTGEIIYDLTQENEPALIIVDRPLYENEDQAILKMLKAGSTLVFLANNAEQLNSLQALSGETLEINEDVVDDYLMLTGIDYKHWLFQPFSDAQYKDFSSIYFWQFRKLGIPADSQFQTIAQFDNQAPAIIAKKIGRGEMLVLATNWNKKDSQLAVNSKFVPFTLALLNASERSFESRFNHRMDSLPTFPQGQITNSAGQAVAELAKPGVYHFKNDQQQFDFSINLPTQESRLKTVSEQEIEKLGVPLISNNALAEHMKNRYISEAQKNETSQASESKIWQYLLLAVLALLAIESLIGHFTLKNMSLE